MGMIDPVMFMNVMPGVLSFGSAGLLWGILMGVLAFAAVGIWAAVPPQRAATRAVPALRAVPVS